MRLCWLRLLQSGDDTWMNQAQTWSIMRECYTNLAHAASGRDVDVPEVDADAGSVGGGRLVMAGTDLKDDVVERSTPGYVSASFPLLFVVAASFCLEFVVVAASFCPEFASVSSCADCNTLCYRNPNQSH
jgi:hypothetical protein